jgi:hypothetical protein
MLEKYLIEKLVDMKKLLLVFVVFFTSAHAFAQYEETDGKKPLFKKENCFTGGTVTLSFGNLYTALGASPFFGYSINKYVDVAAGFGITYISQRDYFYIGDKVRQTIYGPTAFVRLFPVKFLFAQAQYEFNLQRVNYIVPPNSGLINDKYKFDAHSLLIGGGISGGRDFPFNNSYYYISILWDVANSPNSPYKDNLMRAVPIFRAGYNIALFQGRGNQER